MYTRAVIISIKNKFMCSITANLTHDRVAQDYILYQIVLNSDGEVITYPSDIRFNTSKYKDEVPVFVKSWVRRNHSFFHTQNEVFLDVIA